MINYDIKLWPKQGEALSILSNKSKEILGYGGARGGGKSYLARTYAILRALKYVNSKHTIIRKSFPELERNHIIPLRKELPNDIYNYQERHHRFVFKNGSIIELSYIEGERDLFKYQGAEYDTIIIDEATHHSESVFRTMRACLRTTNPDVKPKMLLTSNPGGPGHIWYKSKFIDKKYEDGEDPSQFAFLQSLVYDNPSILDNDPSYVKRLEALPPRLKEAYLHGNWDVFEGQFFQMSIEMVEEPFQLQQSDVMGRLFGSLDSGTAHNTSFGLWYVDTKGILHRLFTYLNNGNTIKDHAIEIKDRIAGFKWTHGWFPEKVFADPAMWTKQRLNEYMTRAQIDEYIDVFCDTPTTFEKANNAKITGCELMQQLFTGENGVPGVKYWQRYNRSFEDGLTSVVVDENNSEIYKKADGDDVADEARYGIVGCYSWFHVNRQATAMKKKVNRYIKQREGQDVDWYNV